jgi:hypothetical protein
MSEAREIYIENSRGAFFSPDKGTALERIQQAADLWRAAGQHFSAGIAMSAAVQAAWGSPDKMAEFQNMAIQDFQRVVLEKSPSSPEALAALQKLRRQLELTQWLFDVDKRIIKAEIRKMGEELAQRLLTHFANSALAQNYLVRGIGIKTDLDGHWEVDFPSYEVDCSVESFGPQLNMGIPSAFHLFVSEEDWYGAHKIATSHPDAFTSDSLKGWRAVVQANVEPSRAVELLDEAANFFELDTMPTPEEMLARRRSWSGINVQLWAKYYRARARIYEAIRKPEDVKVLINKAVQSLRGTESGWHSGNVSRFRILVTALATLVSDPSSLDPEKARREYLQETRISDWDDFDDLALKFITEAAEGFKGYQNDPASELTRNRLSSALEALGRVPLIGPDVAEALRPAIGKTALQTVLGPVRTWLHRALESIPDENKLRGVLLRLLQAGLPLYSQVRHGPIEYGRDIVALVEVEEEVILYLYQVKCGDIDKRKWRESTDELEEMFLVPFSALQLPMSPTRTIGVLVCNGHANPYVEPVMEGWFSQQLEKHGRTIEFHHLDWLVDWITDKRLVNELKKALDEQGVSVGLMD